MNSDVKFFDDGHLPLLEKIQAIIRVRTISKHRYSIINISKDENCYYDNYKC